MAASNEREPMVSTIYRIHGVTSDDDVLELRLSVSSYEEQVGGVSFERLSDGSTLMIIKHKDNIALNDANIGKLVAKAGEFTMERIPS